MLIAVSAPKAYLLVSTMESFRALGAAALGILESDNKRRGVSGAGEVRAQKGIGGVHSAKRRNFNSLELQELAKEAREFKESFMAQNFSRRGWRIEFCLQHWGGTYLAGLSSRASGKSDPLCKLSQSIRTLFQIREQEIGLL